MKRIYFFTSVLFLLFAVIFTVSTVQQYNKTENDYAMSVISTALMYVLSGVFVFLSFSISRHQKDTIEKYRAKYRMLMAMYKDINNNCYPENSPMKQVFCSFVHDFGLSTFDILTKDYPKEVQSEAENMLDDLMRCVVRLS